MGLLIESLGQLSEDSTQSQVARRVGISESLFSRILSGERQLSRQTLAAIARAYPELSPQVSLFLLEEVLIRNDEGSIGNGQ